MHIGISTASFYPMVTEKALRYLGEHGVKTTEVFFNSPSELSDSFLKQLKEIVSEYDMRVTSVHPFTSGMENYLFFSGYRRRFEDSIQLYKRYYEAAALLGAGYVVLHGERLGNHLDREESYARFAEVAGYGKPFGVRLAQENVYNHAGSDLSYLAGLRTCLKDDVSFVLDFKQARRAGVPLQAYIDAMGPCIRHLHLSDASETRDCIPPGKGMRDYAEIRRWLLAAGVRPDVDGVVELYATGYGRAEELLEGRRVAASYFEQEGGDRP